MQAVCTNAIVFHEHGGAEVLKWERQELAPPARGEVRLRHSAIGVNFIDVYDRSGLYARPLPEIPGREAAGVVVALGRGVRTVRIGQRVAYVQAASGAYCEQRNIAAARLVKLPAAISDEQGAALMLKGLTAEYLLRRTYPVRRGDYVLLHAAAGGVGSLLSQWAHALGARVMGIVGSEAKAAIARRQGCHRVFVAGRDDIVASVRSYTRGKMADVVYDSVGKDTFMDSLDSLRPRGMLVSFGNASGPVPAIAPLELARRGSLFLTRPSLFDYIAKHEELETAARALFALVRAGTVRVAIGQRYALKEAAQAHRDLETRRTVGASVLLPDAAD
ncbi:MAG TPA: quinone oxidoreductase [Steroidobacteraceae bacterium]|nr:quinone oxidoreductase [Steroidobacteraceae bacterium]